MDDERLASTIVARLGARSVACTYGDDWYSRGDGWADDLPDYSKD